MPSMIESLIGTGTVRPDNKRLIATRRPMPTRSRDLFEILVALGAQATMPSIFQSVDLRAAEPRTLTYLALNRWPSSDELAALPSPYEPRSHLRALLTGAEFRASLVRRIAEAYIERRRLCFIRIPRCAGGHFLDMAAPMHPLVPRGLTLVQANDHARFIPALGGYLAQFTLTKTIMMMQPHLAPFTQQETAPPDPAYAASGLQWAINPPPRRVGDRLFTILREPTGLILSAVNARVDSLLAPAAQDLPEIATLRASLPSLAGADAAGLKQVARLILRAITLRNPICHAMADGTAEAAMAAIRLQDVELADLSHYAAWIRYTWDVEPEPAHNTATPHLLAADLSPEDAMHLRSLVAEDLILYAPIRQALDNLPELRSSVRGRDL